MCILEVAKEKDHNGTLYCMVRCDQCGRVFQITHSRAERSDKHFCDKECYRRWQIEDWQNK